MRLSLVLPIIFLAVVLVSPGCMDRREDHIALRVAALAYAFEHDPEIQESPNGWLFAVESDEEPEAIVNALGNYPLVHGPLKTEDGNSIAIVDTISGKRVAYWRLKFVKRESGEVWLDVGCIKGGLNGYGQYLVMKKKQGKWLVDRAVPTWIS